MATTARTFIIPSGQNQFIQENVFNNSPIGRIAIALTTNSAFTPHFQGSLFHYRKFGLRELRIVRGGRAVVSIDTTNNCRAYVTTMKAMNFNEEIPGLPNDFFTDLYVLVFDLTSLQDAGENVYYPELSGESLRLEMFFERPLTNVTKLIVLGERISTVNLISLEQLLKMSEELCTNQDFLIFFSIFYGFYIIAFCVGTLVGYVLSSPSCNPFRTILSR